MPTLSSKQSTLKREIHSLQHLDLQHYSIEELCMRIQALLEGQALRCLNFPAGVFLYRGIAGAHRPRCLQEVSYPPAGRVHHDQRASRAGVPMFYCSATWHPPFFEAGVQPQDPIIISRWQTQRPLRIVTFAPAELGVDDPHTDRDTALRRALAQLPAPVRHLSNFLTRAFTKPVTGQDEAHNYRLSIAIAEACQLGTAFDGLLYPSAAMPSPAHNLALHPSCIDKGKLTLQYVEALRVNRVETESLDVCSLDFAGPPAPDGRLTWQGRPGNWILRENAVATECHFRKGKWEV